MQSVQESKKAASQKVTTRRLVKVEKLHVMCLHVSQMKREQV